VITIVDSAQRTIRITANEQSKYSSNGNANVEVNALHIEVFSPLGGKLADIVLGHAHADITCGGNGNVACDSAKVTGGGFIGDKANFAVAGWDGRSWGHVMYKPTGLHVKDPTAVVYTTTSALDTALAGTKLTFRSSMLAGHAGAFQGAAILTWTDANGGIAGQALALDMGEPGSQPKGSDYFEVADANSSVGGGFLQGGNIQIHNCK
jgi:hypothetical protein